MTASKVITFVLVGVMVFVGQLRSTNTQQWWQYIEGGEKRSVRTTTSVVENRGELVVTGNNKTSSSLRRVEPTKAIETAADTKSNSNNNTSLEKQQKEEEEEVNNKKVVAEEELSAGSNKTVLRKQQQQQKQAVAPLERTETTSNNTLSKPFENKEKEEEEEGKEKVALQTEEKPLPPSTPPPPPPPSVETKRNTNGDLDNGLHDDPDDDIHHSSQSILRLQEWEIKTLTQPLGEKSCKTPEGVMDFCCLNTPSHNLKERKPGRFEKERSKCRHLTKSDHEWMEEQAWMELNRLSSGQQGNSSMDDHQCDVCGIVDLLHNGRKDNLTFAFFGDSVTSQTANAFACELQRRNYNVTITQPSFPNNGGDGYRNFLEIRRMSIRSPTWKKKKQEQAADLLPSCMEHPPVNIIQVCKGTIDEVCLEKECRRHLPDVLPLGVARGVGAEKEEEDDDDDDDVVVMDFIFQYRLGFVNPAQEEMITNNYDILVINFGHHWVYQPGYGSKFVWERKRYNRNTLPNQLAELFNSIRNANKVKLLAEKILLHILMPMEEITP